MSTAELTAAPDGGALAQGQRSPGGARSWFRLLGSEVRLIFRRWRNLALLGVLVVLPVVLGIGLRVSTPHGGGGGPDSTFFAQLAGNGVFLAFIALTILLTLVLPLVVAVVAGDSIAGEAGLGTLRYLLTVPAGRTRLLFVKFTAVVLFGLFASLLVTAVSLIMGVILFPVGPVTLLSGTTVPLAEGLLRLLYVALYVAAGLAALGAIGLAISTFTEHAIGAIAAILVLAVASEVADSVSQFAVIHPYLPTHFWLSFDSLLRSPIATADLLHGLLSFAVYIVIFVAIAWARFTSADVTS
ncbi:MAG TPA: ABC transporter permease [Streptosporangiaceae bacterium]|nr:ABC transporter permease [Streptosporangiaceae bacterium]